MIEPTTGGAAQPQDPLAAVTMRPRTFGALLAAVALFTGLILGVAPVRVAGPDPDGPSVTCGSAVGGAETRRIADGVAHGTADPDRDTIVSYVDICERTLDTRGVIAALLFFPGVLGIGWLGVVRRRPALS